LTFFDAGRPSNGLRGGNLRYGVYVDSVLVADLSTYSLQPWTNHTTSFAATAGQHKVEFATIAGSGDNTAFFDKVSLTPVPEPSTFALLGVGAFGLATYAWRKRKWRRSTATEQPLMFHHHPSPIGATTMTRVFFAISVLSMSTVPLCAETVALFDSPTDVIQVGGHTLLGSFVTIEARILFSSSSTPAGMIFDEWSWDREAKAMGVSPTSVDAIVFPIDEQSGFLHGHRTLSPGTWHHVAFVYDGTEERVYADGQKLASRAASGLIGNDDANPPYVGASNRPGYSFWSSFQGYMDTLRISDVARYSGNTFIAPSGKLSSDANTQLLYNFDEMPGSTTITDLSGHGLNGTLGVGFTGATSPEFVANPVPEPSTFALLALAAVGLFAYAWRKRKLAS
jgi:hypothetical protein